MTKGDAASLCALKIWSCVIFSPQSEPKIILEFTSWGFQNCYTNSIWDLLWPSLVKTNTLSWAAWVDTTETRKPMPSSSPSSAPSSGLCLMCSLGDSRWEAGWNSEFLVLVGLTPLVQSCEGEGSSDKKKSFKYIELEGAGFVAWPVTAAGMATPRLILQGQFKS